MNEFYLLSFSVREEGKDREIRQDNEITAFLSRCHKMPPLC